MTSIVLFWHSPLHFAHSRGSTNTPDMSSSQCDWPGSTAVTGTDMQQAGCPPRPSWSQPALLPHVDPRSPSTGSPLGSVAEIFSSCSQTGVRPVQGERPRRVRVRVNQQQSCPRRRQPSLHSCSRRQPPVGAGSVLHIRTLARHVPCQCPARRPWAHPFFALDSPSSAVL